MLVGSSAIVHWTQPNGRNYPLPAFTGNRGHGAEHARPSTRGSCPCQPSASAPSQIRASPNPQRTLVPTHSLSLTRSLPLYFARRRRRRAPLDPAATGPPERRVLDYEVHRPLLLPPGPPAGAGKLSSAGSPRSTTVGIAAAAASTCNTGAPRPLQARPDLTVSHHSYPLSPHA